MTVVDANPSAARTIAEPVRHLLRAVADPGGADILAPGLLRVLCAGGYEADAAWLPAPTPTTDPDTLWFRLEVAGMPATSRPGGDLGAVLAELCASAEEPEAVVLWVEDGAGLERLALAGGAGRPAAYVPATVDRYVGGPEAVDQAVAAWRHALSAASPPTLGGGVALADPPGTGALPCTGPVVTAPPHVSEVGPGPALDPEPAPRNPSASPRSSRSAPGDGTPLPLDRAALADALQVALGQVQVEVDVGAIGELVSDALRVAIAELPAAAPLPPPAAPPLVNRASPAPPEGLAAVVATGEVDAVDVARRLAASVLSPREIGESLVLRVRPLLDDVARAAAEHHASLAERDRAAVTRILERLDERVAHLERRSGSAP